MSTAVRIDTPTSTSLVGKFVLVFMLLAAGIHPALAERTATFFHTDALGSVVAATNEQGSLLWRKDYAPYGEQIDTTPDGEALSYTGKQHDEITGLTYFGARYYDADIARFLSIDPVGVDPARLFSFNRYAYANDNPYRYVDPDGRDAAERIHGFAIGLVYTKEQAALVQRVYLAGGTREAAYAIDTGQAVADASRSLARGESVDVAWTTAAMTFIGLVVKRKGGKTNGARPFSKEKQALVDMAQYDKRKGMTPADMQAYKDLNKELPDPFPTNKVRGPEAHSGGAPHSRQPHGHVGPVDHIPIRERHP